ncbi:hypothetical protein IG631_21166 [Alternaria alternata]|nr:hypothetical protein IG631_21166 [Alternaria alternata]
MASIEVGKVEQSPHSCHYCQAVTIGVSHSFNRDSSFVEHGTLDIPYGRARHAAADGCKLFEYMMQRYPNSHEDKPLEYLFSYNGHNGMTGNVILRYPTTSRVFKFCSFEIYAADEATSDNFVAPPNLSPASTSAAEDWLVSCVQEHKKCRRVDDVFVPPRLLRVTCAQDEVHLVSMDVTKPVPYAALSYCWGGDQLSKTVKSNVEIVPRAIKDLPQTIHDAILVTRQLKLEYLWVDSMCIIQDSDEDKDALIGQMHKIFACAQVTIAASKASRCTEGFLAPRPTVPQFYAAIRAPLGTDNGIPRRVILMPYPKRRVEPLVRRAWSLQETVLSRRILSYGNRQLYWYCGVCVRHDGGVLDRESPNWASLQTPEEQVAGNPRERYDVTPISTISRWIGIVKQYTMREMSEPSDKLIAISAVAQRLVNLTEGKWGRYYAGIWTEHFFQQLLWATSESEIAKRPVRYRAPSWSWAAIDGRVDWPSMFEFVGTKILCKLLDVEIQLLRSQQPYGAVTAGRIQVYGEVKQVLWSADRKTVKDNGNQAATTDGIMQTFPDVREHNAHGMIVHVLKVAMCSCRRFSIGNKLYQLEYVEGILLEHIGNEVYQRVGLIGVRSVEDDRTSLPGWLEQSSLESRQWWSTGFIGKEIYIV